MKRVAFFGLLALTIALTGIMVGWSVPTLRALGRGIELFDMRVAGYGLADAQAILVALGPAGTAFYRAPQHVLDTAVPPLLTLSLFFGIAALAPPPFGRWRWAVAALALPAAPLDLMENHLVEVMLDLGPAGLTADIVAMASICTVLKFIVLMLAFGLVAVFAAMRLTRHRPA